MSFNDSLPCIIVREAATGQGSSELGLWGQALPGWNSSSAISCLSALGQVTHPLCLSFPICKKEVIALLLKVTGRIKGSVSDLCASLQ